MSHVEEFEGACNLAHVVEAAVEELRPLVQRCHRNRHVGDVYFDNDCLNCVVEELSNIAHDLSTDLEFSNAIGSDNTLHSHVSLARDLCRALAHAHRLARVDLRREMTNLQSFSTEGSFDGALSRRPASRIIHARRLKREIWQIGRLALTVATTVADVRGRPIHPELQSEIDHFLAAFGSQEPEEPQGTVPDVTTLTTNQPIQSALRLSILATRLLPRQTRARYREEWSAELATVAEQATRRAQLWIGLKYLSRSISLRVALTREPSSMQKRQQ